MNENQLFESYQPDKITLANRMVMAPVTRSRSAAPGYPTIGLKRNF